MKKLIILLCVVLIGCELSDDPMGPMLPESASALAFVDSINQHFYKLHSQNFENAKAQTERAIAISRTNTWPDKEALASKNLGVVLYMQGQYEPAQVAFLRAYKLYDSLSDKSGLARVCNEMGAFYRKHGYEEQAMNLWNQAEDLAKEADDLEALGKAVSKEELAARRDGPRGKRRPHRLAGTGPRHRPKRCPPVIR